MNKKLVAVAVAGVLAAPLAQAQTANVTLYGRINIDMEFVSGRLANNTDPTVYRVTSNSSRFGLRGTESLGGGLNAIFQIENGSIRPTTGDGGNLAGRDSFVGLSGAWGTFKMGRYLAPYDDIHGIFGNDNTAATSILSTASVWAQGFAGQPSNGGFDDRLMQSIRYDSPSWAGLTASAQFSTNGGQSGPGSATAPSNNTNAQSYGVFYRNGPFVGGVAYEYHHNQRGLASLPLSDWAFSVAAKWQFSGFNIAGVYEKMEYEVSNGPTAATQVRNKLKRNSFWAVDTTINVGANGQLFLYWGKASDGSGSAQNTPGPVVTNTTCSASGVCIPGAVSGSNISRVAGLAKGDNTGATHWEISYSYDLSRRTRIYTGYVRINNDSNASYNFNINPYPGNAGTVTGGPVGMNVSGFVMGMYHNF
jgi:predicted porin